MCDLPGDLQAAEVRRDNALLLTRGSWIASSDGVEIATKWGGMSNLIDSEGGFLIKARATASSCSAATARWT
ncbi:hypothetical protein [Nonomuraea jabiensis]|uniref:Uncharacterized protein (AIM24 family) n=1 Tax=Nonomuraea jabiensis TaxID=882448 RepID=A0A7W9LG73_9ACTN|nr:hypothetical protein [Nonomuraea jabiensis]MBB5782669.1 uncharacterized protein (AIM24 family) [Nonomuraea jabiensis]